MAEKDAHERLVILVNQIFEGDNQNSGPKIQRVPAILRQNEDLDKYWSPKIISFGPIHHQNENVLGQQFKNQWTYLYFREYYGANTAARAHEAAQSLLNTVQENIQELRQLFTADLTVAYRDSVLSWMLLVDGCSLLYYLEHVDDHCPDELKLKLDQLMYTWRDISLLENQLPMRLLELLCKPGGHGLPLLLLNFGDLGETKRQGWENPRKVPRDAMHILDFYRSSFCVENDFENQQAGVVENANNVRNNAGNQQGGAHGNQQDGFDIEYPNNVRNNAGNQHGGVHGNQQDGVDIGNRNYMANQNDGHGPPSLLLQKYKNIRDLKKAGIQVKATDDRTKTICERISFTSNSKWSCGELTLPVYVFNDFTPYFFRNLVAYEMCPDFRNNFGCCSFFSFMDYLIDDAEDVKELRLAGVIQNFLGSDEELAKFFNEIGRDLPTKMSNNRRTDSVAYSEKYCQLKREMEMHCSIKWNTWWAEFRNTHFNSPWSVSAFLAALLALVLTFIQAWYAIHPKK